MQRRQTGRTYRSLSVPAGTRRQPGGLCAWHPASRLDWRSGGLGWLHAAVGSLDDGLRVWPLVPCRRHRDQTSPRAATCRGRRGCTSCSGNEDSSCSGSGAHGSRDHSYRRNPIRDTALFNSDRNRSRRGRWVLFCRSEEHDHTERIMLPLPRAAAGAAAIIFFALLVLPPLIVHHAPIRAIVIFSAFYRSGALVFGGGHVVLPLIENTVVTPGWVTQQSFLAGYGAAQALPGPLFSFAAYLGASAGPEPKPLLYGLLGLIGIFTPGLAAMAAVLPFWSTLRDNFYIPAALKGINASVVGILIAALFRPLWTSTVHTAGDFWIMLWAFTLLTFWRVQPWIVVACGGGPFGPCVLFLKPRQHARVIAPLSLQSESLARNASMGSMDAARHAGSHVSSSAIKRRRAE